MYWVALIGGDVQCGMLPFPLVCGFVGSLTKGFMLGMMSLNCIGHTFPQQPTHNLSTSRMSAC